MKQLICLSPIGWCETPSRAQQLLGRMRDTKILFFSPHGTNIHPSGERVRPNITVYTLPKRMFPAKWNIERLIQRDYARMGRFVAKMSQKHNFRRPLLWTTCPSHVHLLPHIEFSGLIYDCDQEWDDLPIEWEGALARRADFIFAVSNGLRDRLSPCNPNIAVVPNGANFPLFSANERFSGSIPSFGWVGRISSDLDLSPVVFSAHTHPEWRFYLVGEVESDQNPQLAALRRLGNVRFFPACPLSDVPQYLGHCHVLMDLARKGSAGSDIVPRRIYEYLSTGLPIVSMLLPDQVELFPDVIYGAHDNAEFLNMCEQALDEPSGFLDVRRRRHGEDSSWVARATEISQILNSTGFL